MPVFDCENKVFGNMEEVVMETDKTSIASQIEEQKRHIMNLNVKLDTTARSDISPIRQGVLDGNTSIVDRNIRNETAHGGNILVDIELIEFMERVDIRRANSWGNV